MVECANGAKEEIITYAHSKTDTTPSRIRRDDGSPVSPGADAGCNDATYDERLIASRDWPLAKASPSRRFVLAVTSRRVALGFAGFAALVLFWYVSSAIVSLPGFKLLPDPKFLFSEWTSRHPEYGISLFTPLYYEHILVSTARVYAAFALAVVLGAPLGILLGWSRMARNMVLPVVEVLRPIPPLAWLPLAMLILYGTEMPVIFVTFLAAFFAIVLNTRLGVLSIDESHLRAAACLGYGRWSTLMRVVVPGALPSILTGLQIAMGVAWFVLVGGELLARRSGLGYMIFDHAQVALPNALLGMVTLGLLGSMSTALIRRVGRQLLRWQAPGA